MAPTIEQEPDTAEAELALGNAKLVAGHAAGAISHFEQALARRPELASAHNSLGAALEAVGRPIDAIAHYERAIALTPAYAEAHANLGNAFTTLGRGDQAIAAYDRALSLNPDLTEARYNLGTALYALGRCEEAATQFQRMLVSAPDHAEAHNNLGVALQTLDRPTEAIEHYRRAVALKPGLPDPYGNVGNLLMELGAIEAAEAALLVALALAPRRGTFYFNLANVRKFAAGDQYLQAMERLAADPTGLGESDLTALHFALGKAYADLGDIERCFAHLLTGNARRRQRIVYDEAATLARMDRIRRAFDRALMDRLGGRGDPSAFPVFIVGMPRSGTTLVEQILASHPNVFGAGELYDLDRIVTGLGGDPDGFPERVAAMTGAQLRGLATRYLEGLKVGRADVTRVTDKMPWNFRFLGLIHLMLPNARIVHVNRDPVETCLSCFSKLFNKNQEFSYDLGELGRYYRAYRALMDHWRDVLPPDVMLDIQYEEVVADLEGQARRIVAHCGLDWNDACLAFHRTERPVRTASAAQVRQPLYRSSVDRWRPYRPLAGALLDALGPDLIGTESAP